ncbi:methyltransferase domain-containing protein [Aurantibacter aestuarii]|uniref:SAM-dependent methyltransferase n=1 Tax=Aurantibacter aestuarii TaxID=1266046 RepID=A0A2T1NEG2_9FLAO|nr:methyltransferase domain-containing protein [Aurantibacter aestuarii]PSG90841.1 SAM-dependent methyltransferase [Aurantibacter aestuarii]
MSTETENYWSNRYTENETGWDIGYVSTPLKTYFDQLEHKTLKILIPGAGNAYEAEYVFKQGFKNVFVLDISEIPLNDFKKRNPDFPEAQLIHEDFFEHKATYDLIIEQTFFCSFPPLKKSRASYAKQMFNLLNPKGKLVGLWFNFPLTNSLEKRPFGGDKNEYLSYFKTYFKVKTFELCYNSIPERKGKEFFGVLNKK